MISVIVPFYKVEQYLHRCIDSILAQTYRDLEIILVDDGSPDNCGLICDEYASKDSRIKVIHKTNGGVSSARNAGLDAASGDYIAFVDSDDYLMPNMYEILLETLLSKEADIAICNYQWGNSICVDSYEVFEYTGEEAILKAFSQNREGSGISISPFDKLFTSKCFKSTRFRTDLHVAEDIECISRVLFESKKVVKLDCTLYIYSQAGTSLIRSPYSREKAWGDIKCYNSLLVYFDNACNESIKRIMIKQLSGKLFYHYYKLSELDGFTTKYDREEIAKLIRDMIKNKTVSFFNNRRLFIKHLLFMLSPQMYQLYSRLRKI